MCHCRLCTTLISPQIFHQVGFAATQVFERAGPIIDPMYHNSGTYNCLATSAEARLSQLYCAGDLSDREGYDFEQIKSIAKVQVCIGFFVSRD